jgi:HlyD family secretion protein
MESANGTGVAEESVKEQRQRRRREARTESQRKRTNNDALLIEFQPDAVEIEKRSVPGGARWTLYVVVLLMITAVAWASWAEVDQIVTAEGQLVNTESAVVIDSKLASPIASINAKFGDRVSAGFVIATVDPTFSAADVNQLKAQEKSLSAMIARLSAEHEMREFSIDGFDNDPDWLMQYQVFAERKRDYLAQLGKLSAQQQMYEVQKENNAVEIKGNKIAYKKFSDFEETIKKLAVSGSKSSQDVLSRELQTIEATMKALGTLSRQKELVQSIESSKAEKAAFVAQWRTQTVSDLVAAKDELKGIQQELNKANRSNEFVELVVPDDLPYKEFVVFEVAEVSVGSTTQPGEPLFRLIPIGVPMEVEVEVQGKDIALLNTAGKKEISSGELPSGSDVRVKLSSFPYQKHGTLDGVIRTISEGSFEKQAPGGAPLGMTTYKARVSIMDANQLNHVPDNFRLMPGMTATAEIKVGRRKVIEYFLYPLLRYMDRSIREPT